MQMMQTQHRRDKTGNEGLLRQNGTWRRGSFSWAFGLSEKGHTYMGQHLPIVLLLFRPDGASQIPS